VAALTAYFDASGKASNPASIELVVSGFVSTQKKWRQFDNDWRGLLKEFDVPYFHMKEFAPSTGIFKDWKDKERRRRKFLQRLIDITVANTEQSIAAGVLLNDWRKANRRYKLKENDWAPYALCGRTCVDQVYKWCDEQGHSRNQVVFMFEDGDEDQNALNNRVKKDFGIKLEFGPKVPNPFSTKRTTDPAFAGRRFCGVAYQASFGSTRAGWHRSASYCSLRLSGAVFAYSSRVVPSSFQYDCWSFYHSETG